MLLTFLLHNRCCCVVFAAVVTVAAALALASTCDADVVAASAAAATIAAASSYGFKCLRITWSCCAIGLVILLEVLVNHELGLCESSLTKLDYCIPPLAEMTCSLQ